MTRMFDTERGGRSRQLSGIPSVSSAVSQSQAAPAPSPGIGLDDAEDAISGILARPTVSGISALRTRLLSRVIENVAVQDLFVAGYFVAMLGALALGAGPLASREACARTVLIDLAIVIAGVTLTRGSILRQGTFANALTYRLSLFFPVFLSYFQLRNILPAVAPGSVDGKLVELDLRIFGVEPALAWDRFVTPHTTEWFAFFYFGYFFLLSAHVLPMMFNASNRFRLAHFSLGIFMVACIGHFTYMLVPGWGPYHYLADHFEHPLTGGLFWHLVKATVDAGGSQKDIFPSLHTALPTYFAIFSFMHRKAFPFRYTWPPLAFAVTQIIGATMFLRWHYLIDICAGLTLATTAALVSHRIVTWETARREKRGLPPIFTLLVWPRSHVSHDASGDSESAELANEMTSAKRNLRDAKDTREGTAQ